MVKKMKNDLWSNGSIISLTLYDFPLEALEEIVDELIESIEYITQDIKARYT